MIQTFTYNLSEIVPYINWVYFFHAWQLKHVSMHTLSDTDDDKVSAEERTVAENLLSDAREWLLQADAFTAQARLGLFDANSEGDDIIVFATKEMRLPMLRQQHTDEENAPNYCLADFIRPVNETHQHDRIGIFAATASPTRIISQADDPYRSLMQQTLCDRLAEAAIEKLHADVRKSIWGYAPQEKLSIDDMLSAKFQGIRPAVGYPSMPDQSINFMLDELIDFSSIHIQLTENGAMDPHSSVSGLIISHPQSRYFSIGKIGDDQLEDYARRRRMTVSQMRHFLAANL